MGRSSGNGLVNPVLGVGAQMLIIAALSSGVVLAQERPAPVVARANDAAVVAAMAPGAVPATGAAPAAAARAVTPDIGKLELIVGRSAIVDVGHPITRVSLTSDDVADVLVTSASQILVNGKTPGSISMVVWEKGGAMHRYEVSVGRDLATLDRQLETLFPGEKIEAHSSGKQIVLSGRASSKDVADRAVNVAAGFVAKRDEVVSLLQVTEVQGGGRQVLLRVRFAEVSRSALTELGVSLFTGPTGIENTLGRITTQQFQAPNFEDLGWSKNSNDFGAPVTNAEGKITFSDFLNFFVLNQKYDLGLLVRALQTRGLFQSLAEPNLVAESGKEASFLAGGEFPIPVAQGSGANIGVSVMFKEFGVRLGFTPVINGDRIHLKVRPEVSTLDFANAVMLSGFRIPALTTRRTETELELRDGQSFAIAGLFQDNFTDNVSQLPWIGEVPILGALFRSTDFQKNQTELVILVTPHLVTPGDATAMTLPTDAIAEPKDFDLFFYGRTEGHKFPTAVGPGPSGPTQLMELNKDGGVSGDYGYIIQ